MVGSNSHVVDVSLLIWMHGIFSSLAWSFVFLRMSDQLNSRELNGHTFRLFRSSWFLFPPKDLAFWGSFCTSAN